MISLTTGQTLTVLQLVSPLYSLYSLLNKFDGFERVELLGGSSTKKIFAYGYIAVMAMMLIIGFWQFFSFFSFARNYPPRYDRLHIPRPAVKPDWA